MKKQYYQVVMTFSNPELQHYMKTDFESSNDNSVIIDDNIDEQYAEDPLMLSLLIALAIEATKTIGKESISWLFESLKKKLDKKNEKNELPDKVEITIKVHDKQFLFKYDKVNGEYLINEIE